ncbi:pseudouridine synthase [Spirosoma areae]
MNQDSDQNESRRDGKPRSFGRREDGRTPRANRDGDSRPTRNDERPRVDRDRPNRPDSRPDGPPRFNRESNNDRPRFSRNDDSRPTNRPNDDRRGDSRPPRFDRDQNDRPKFNRDNANRDTKPRFNQEQRDSRFGNANPRPRGERDGEATGRPRFENDRNRPTDRFGKDSPRPAGRFTTRDDDRRTPRPRTNRDGDSRNTSRSEERPRFDRDRPNRDDKRSEGPPRFNRERTPRDTERKGRYAGGDSRRSRDDRPQRPSRFSRDSGPGRPEKPGFKRVGGFNREADERNNSRFGREDQPGNSRRERGSRGEDQPAEPSRFSSQQRKESGDRRTGDYTKAPDYNLEQARERTPFRRDRADEPRGDRKGGGEKPARTPSNDRNHDGGPDGAGLTRLNRYIANSGVCSRREADELIAQGDISVNGKVVTEMGYKVKEGDTVKYGTKVLNPERFVYVLLNKPKDYITTTEDPEERKTVMELVADAGSFRMYPVGRLDRNTTGLLLLTNDGELADKLTHPSNNIRKIYQVELDKPITNEHFEALKKGIELEDGPIKPDAISIVTPDAYVVGIEIHSGRNRIVRRMFESFGYDVSKLDRTTYAGLTKKELPRGKWRFLDPKEVVKLKYLNS